MKLMSDKEERVWHNTTELKKTKWFVAFHTNFYGSLNIKPLGSGTAKMDLKLYLSAPSMPFWDALLCFSVWEPRSCINRLLHFAYYFLCKLHRSDWSWIRGQTDLSRNRYCMAPGFPVLLQAINWRFAFFPLNAILSPLEDSCFVKWSSNHRLGASLMKSKWKVNKWETYNTWKKKSVDLYQHYDVIFVKSPTPWVLVE